MDEKGTHFAVHISPDLDFLNIPLHPAPFQKYSGIIIFSYVEYFMSNVHHSFVSFIFGLFPPPQKYLVVELSFLASYWYKFE